MIYKNKTFWVLALFWTAVCFWTGWESYAGNQSILESIQSFVAPFSAGFGVLIPMFTAAINSENDRKFKVIENTYQLIAKYDDPHFAEARKFTRKVKKEDGIISSEYLMRQIENNEELEHSIILILNYIENSYMAIESGRVDKEIFKRYLGEVIYGFINRFDNYIKKYSLKKDQEILNQMKKIMECE